MEEDRKDETTEDELSDDARRGFLKKVASAAGAMAAVGVTAAALTEEAEAQPRARAEVLRNTPLRYERIGRTHVIRLQGPEIASILAREGLVPKEDANKADVGIAIRIGSQLAKP